MSSELTVAIYELLTEDKPLTAAGAAYRLRDDFVPIVFSVEAEQSLDWLRRNGYAKTNGDNGFGMEYLKTRKQ
jgi:hypothetical protein